MATTASAQRGKPARRVTTRTSPATKTTQTPVPNAPAKQNTRESNDETAPTPTTATKRNSRDAANSDSSATTPVKSDDKNLAAKTDAATVRYSYEFKQPDFNVNHILIEHDATGRGRISFERISDTEMLVEPLNLSAAALERIKALWSALRFLESTESYQSEKQFAHLGTMRLSMKQGTRERVAEFNWTHNQDASNLVNEYRRVAEQSILVFEIGVALELQPLEMARLVNRFATLLERDMLSDPQQLLPLLRDLQTDERVPLVARNHAERLLKKIEKNSGGQ
ncbi:MAG TPA: hypothetical protein VF666_00095 [Pyrinomonadaceae bacterium]|jgi:hypothetical protein